MNFENVFGASLKNTESSSLSLNSYSSAVLLLDVVAVVVDRVLILFNFGALDEKQGNFFNVLDAGTAVLPLPFCFAISTASFPLTFVSESSSASSDELNTFSSTSRLNQSQRFSVRQ